MPDLLLPDPLRPAPLSPMLGGAGIPDTANAEDGGIDLRELLGILRRHFALAVLVAITFTAIVGYFAYRAQPVYSARAVIQVSDTRGQMTAGLENSDVGTMVASNRADPILSEIQILESGRVAQEVVRRHPLALRVVPLDLPLAIFRAVTVDSVVPVSRDTLAFAFGATDYTVRGKDGVVRATYGAPAAMDGTHFVIDHRPVQPTGSVLVQSEQAGIVRFDAALSALVRKGTNIVDVTYQDSDPRIARDIVDTAVVAFQEVNVASAQDQSHRRRMFIESQLAQTDSELEAAQQALSNFASSRQVYGSDQVIAAQQTGLMQLDMTRGDLAANRAMYISLLDSLKQASGQHAAEKLNAIVSSPGVAQNPVIVALFQQLVLYEGKLDSMTAGPWANAPGSPDVKRVESLVTVAQQRLRDATQSQIDALSARIVSLDTLKARTAAQLQKLPATQASEATLMEQVDATRKVADQLRDEYQKARIEEAVEAGQVEIVDLATQPRNPIGRGPRFKLAVGLILGLFFGLGAALLAENLNTAIRKREDIETLLRVPGLAIVPQILPSKGRRLLPGGGQGALASSNGSKNGSRNGSGGATLIAATEMRSPGAEAFRTLRTNLVFSQAVQTLRVVGITSAVPAEGKTTTAANLAVTFAQQGMRVIIVDCDLRRPRLHEVFGQGREPGLTNVLVGQGRLDLAVRTTGIEHLWFLPTGPLPPNPAELLGGAAMKTVLAALREQFDIVVLDMPPVHVAADALILSREADGVLVVVRAGKTDRHAAQDAMKGLVGVGARVIGAVLNDPDHKVAAYGGYYYYDYYGSGEERIETATK